MVGSSRAKRGIFGLESQFVDENKYTYLRMENLQEYVRSNKPNIPREIEVRTADPEKDGKNIADIFNTSFNIPLNSSDAMRPDSIKKWCRHPDFDPKGIFIATSGEEIVGLCMANSNAQSNSKTGRKEGRIELVCVHPQYRSLRLARGLTLLGMTWLSEKGIESVCVHTGKFRPKHDKIVRALKSVGFYEY